MEMASVLRYDTGLRFTASRHLVATKEHATATKHDNKIHGRDAHKMLNKRLALSHGQFIN